MKTPPVKVRPLGRKRKLRLTLEVPGDKSISHRAALLGGLAKGTTVIKGYSPGDDCLHTLTCLRLLGAEATLQSNAMYGPGTGTTILIKGAGLRGLSEPPDILDCGNSGTTMRLLAGVLAGQAFISVLTGDRSLRSRPMDRIAAPLRMMGARIDGRDKGRKAPLSIRGGNLTSLGKYRLQIASAQVKSCLMLAALYADGPTALAGAEGSRDHTERLLPIFEAPVENLDGTVCLRPPEDLRAAEVSVPGDASSAAFWTALGAIIPESHVQIGNVGLNPTRTGFFRILERMGCDLRMVDRTPPHAPEQVGDIAVKGSELKGIEIGPHEIPSVIDEIPLIGVCAAFARGVTRVRGAGELRHKESDRITAVTKNLRSMGADVEELPDGFAVHGKGALKGGFLRTRGDHRIAMAFAVAALASDGDSLLDNLDCANASYPGFRRILESLEEDD